MRPLSLVIIILLSIPLTVSASFTSDQALVNRGWRLANDLYYEQALENFRYVASGYTNARNKKEKALCLDALYGCIDANIHMANFMAAFDDLLTAQDIVDSEGLSDTKLQLNLARLYIVLAVQTPKQELMGKALTHSRLAFDTAVKENDDNTIFYAFHDMVTISYVLQDLSLMDREYKIMHQRGEKENRWDVKYNLSNYMARKYALKKDYGSAKKYFVNSLSLIPDIRSTSRLRAAEIKDIALMDVQADRADSALIRLNQALNIAEKYKQTDLKYNIYRLFIQAYELKNDTAKINYFNNRAMHLKDSIRSFAISDNMSQLEYFRERRILTNQLAIASIRQQILLWGFILALVIVAAVVVFALILRSKNSKLRQQAAQIYSQLREKYIEHNPKYENISPKDASGSDSPNTNNELDDNAKTIQTKYEGSNLTDIDKERIAGNIDRVMKTDVIFSPNLSLNSFAMHVGCHPKSASQVIHEIKGCNFSTLINRARIVEAMRRMESSEYAHLSTEAIAESVGFTSRNTFGMNFKKFAGGLSLREYRKAAKDAEKKKSQN